MSKISVLTKKIKSFFGVEKRRSLLTIFEKMGLLEKTIFFALFALMSVSALIMLKKASDAFSIEIPVQGGMIREGVIGYPRYVNPLLPITDSGKDLSELVFSGLMRLGSDGKLDYDLAESYTLSDDGLTYTFTLKDNIYFHDNTPVTAYDVEYTVNKIKDPIIKSPKAANWDGVDVKAVDPKTVVFTLKKAYAPFIENLTLGILPKHIWKDIDSDGFLFSEFNFEPVGSGPYKIKEIVRNSSGLPEYYHLVPFDKYTNGDPYIEDVYMYFYTNEDELLSAYQSGTIDSMSSISPENIKKIDLSRSQIVKTPLPRTYAVFLNQNKNKLFADPNIRKALRLATPKQDIINNVLLGFATPIESPLPPSISTIKPYDGSYDEAKQDALALLAKSGWTIDTTTGLATKKDKKSSQTLSFSLSIPDVTELKAVANELKSAWATIGVTVDVKVFDNTDLQQKIIVPRDYEALLFGESTGRNSDFFAFWHSSERNHPGLNIALYTNPKADKILQDLRTTNDDTKKATLYRNLENEIDKDTGAIFLYSPDLVYIVPKEIQGIAMKSITGSFERFATISSWYEETEKIWNL